MSSKKKKLAILGCRGIPNRYGGFEQFAEILSKRIVDSNYDVTVYASHNHVNQDKEWEGVNIIHKYDPEYLIGTFGQFIYDFNCIRDIRKRNFNIILQLGYTSSSVWGWMLPKKPLIVTNMDGLEWKRAKYSYLVKQFLRFAEYLAIKTSDFLIADSIVMQQYLKSYSDNVQYLSYGAEVFDNPNVEIVKKSGLIPYGYNMLIARMVPENNIETILCGVSKARSNQKFIVIGNVQNAYGQYLTGKFKNTNIEFKGSVYDMELLNNLRYYSNIYFHGHSVGGTNPSLLEAMSSSAFICAHENDFNKSVVGENAIYFKDENDVSEVIDTFKKAADDIRILNNKEIIRRDYSWDKIVSEYRDFFESCCHTNTATHS